MSLYDSIQFMICTYLVAAFTHYDSPNLRTHIMRGLIAIYLMLCLLCLMNGAPLPPPFNW